jgi:hypothetical protein
MEKKSGCLGIVKEKKKSKTSQECLKAAHKQHSERLVRALAAARSDW